MLMITTSERNWTVVMAAKEASRIWPGVRRDNGSTAKASTPGRMSMNLNIESEMLSTRPSVDQIDDLQRAKRDCDGLPSSECTTCRPVEGASRMRNRSDDAMATCLIQHILLLYLAFGLPCSLEHMQQMRDRNSEVLDRRGRRLHCRAVARCSLPRPRPSPRL